MDEILFEKLSGKTGCLGVVILNRPRALNALNHSMVQAFNDHLDRWADDESVRAVFVYSSCEKAFCAGGDIFHIYQAKQKGYLAEDFFEDEYLLNQKIYEYPKPYIAFLNGITMGGGVGISIHGSHRIATETFLFSMPETSIGFFPDVGGSYFLSHLNNHVGMYLGLTGARLNLHEAKALGLVDYFIPHQQLNSIKQFFLETSLDFGTKEAVSYILQTYSTPFTPAPSKLPVDIIQAVFGLSEVEKILEALAKRMDPFSQETLKILKRKSPTSLKVTHKGIRKGQNQNIRECLAMEYGLAKHFLQSHDFFEGIRAVIVDKDQTPRWKPASLEEVTAEMVDAFFSSHVKAI
jgi:enoyl-CoA hydratase